MIFLRPVATRTTQLKSNFTAMYISRLTREISSSGCINLEVKPELDSGFLITGAPVIVALACSEVAVDVMAAAEGKVGFGGPAEDEVAGLELLD